MSYLSRVMVDPVQAKVMRALAGPTALHHTMYAAFPRVDAPGGGRKLELLYRLEPERVGRQRVLLVQSTLAPDWGRASDHLPGAHAQVREDLDEMLAAALAPGLRLRFRLRANPTRAARRADAEGRPLRGKRQGVLGEEAQQAWLRAKLAGLAAVTDVQVVDEGLWCDAGPAGRQFQSALFDGHLQVVDAAGLAHLVKTGLGRGKAFGFGLLSLAPA